MPDRSPSQPPAKPFAIARAVTDTVVEMRGEKRASLLIRSAKLICQSGEYPCIVRDASAGGVKLRYFQELPPEAYVLLELTNGETFAMHRVWDRALEGGYRFLRQIDVDMFIEEHHEFPRRPLRLRLRRTATVAVGGKPIDAVLRNLSQGGACIDAASELALRQPVRVALPGMAECYARVCWRRGLMHGLVFERSLRMDELARIALDLQPFLPESALQKVPQMFDKLPALERRASA